MKRRDILLAAIRNQQTPRAAWVPFVGVHGAKLIHKTATEYLQSADLIVQGLKRANEIYRPDGLPIAFDLQIEAEILGCRLHWADEVPPSVTTHPLSSCKIADLPAYDAGKGRLPVVLEALDIMKRDLGDEIALYGLICGPFTLALHLLGNDIFLDMFDKPEEVKEVVSYCADIGIKTAGYYLDHGADVIAVVDPMTSQISPAHFGEFVAPYVNRVFDFVRSRQSLSSIFVCGDVTRNLEVMCQTRADNISVDEQINMATLRELCGRTGKSFGGNIKLTAVLLLGDEDDAKMEAVGILDQCGTKGFVLAPGCDLPYAVPEKNLEAVATMALDEYRRQVARETLHCKKSDSFDDIQLPDYQARNAVVIDVITLDSTSCAPCQYMLEAVQKAANTTPVRVFINEHKIKVRQGIGMMVKLGVKNLPTICIDGEIKFASMIPDQKTLVGAIEAAARAKMQG